MRWLASNWVFILLVVGMAWMHLGHGGHGGGHQTTPGAGRGDAGGSDHGGHAAAGAPPIATGAPSEHRLGPASTGPKEAV